MNRTPLALLAVAAGLSACVARPPNNTTAEGQAFFACDRVAIDQTAAMPDLIPQVRGRESVRGECLASNAIPPMPGAKYVQAPVVLPPLPPAPVGEPAAPLQPAPVVPDSQNYQPPPIVQPPPPS